MLDKEKICDILSDLVKSGIVADFNINNSKELYEVILYDENNNKCIVNNFKKCGIFAEIGENPELLIIYFNDESIINSIFEKYY